MSFGIGVIVGELIALGLNLIGIVAITIWEKRKAKKAKAKVEVKDEE